MKTYLTMTAFFLFLLSCAEKPADENQSADENKTIAIDTATKKSYSSTVTDVRWELTELDGKLVSQYPAQNKEAYIMLKTDGTIEGTGGCNGMGGNYSLASGGKISFSNLISTKMACPDMTLESDFHKALESVDSYSTDGKMLMLGNEAKPMLAKLKAAGQ